MSAVTVLGAGVIGITTAYALAKKGFSVTVVDEGGGPAENGASKANGAQLSYAYTDAMASPTLLRSLPKYLMGLDDAFRFRINWSPQFWAWAIEFLANARQSTFEHNTIELLKLAAESRLAFGDLKGKFDFDHKVAGKLHILPDGAAVEQARALSLLKRKFDVEQDILTPAQATDLEPALKSYHGEFAAALWSPFEEVGDPLRFCHGMRALLERDYNVRFIFRTSVLGLIVKNNELVAVKTSVGEIAGSRAVIALGERSADIASSVGVSLPIWPIQGYSLTVPATDMCPNISITDAARKLVFCKIGDRLRIAGLADIGRRRLHFRAERFEKLIASARSALPMAGDYSANPNAWTGQRPMSPNSQPIIGATRRKGLFLNCGHGSLGWTLSMGSANRLAAAMT